MQRVECAECGKPLRQREPRHRVGTPEFGAYFHTRQAGHSACSDAAMKYWRQRRGPITYIRPAEDRR